MKSDPTVSGSQVGGSPHWLPMAGLLRPSNRFWRSGLITLVLAMRMVVPAYGQQTNTVESAESVEPAKPARLKVSGFGVLGNRTLRSTIRELLPERDAPELDANFVEDAFVLLHARLGQEGYLHPTLVANLTLTNGTTIAIWWDGVEDFVVPRDLKAVGAEFEVIRSTLYYYETVEFSGLHALPEAQARAFFFPRDELLQRKEARPYSPDHLRRSIANLERELHQRGYREATVEVGVERILEETGAVTVRLDVREGPQLVVESMEVDVVDETDSKPLPAEAIKVGEPFSITWEQDAAYAVTREYYRQGYADARTQIRERSRTEHEGTVGLALVAEVTRGEQVELGEIRFEGAEHTRESFLRRRVRLEGPLLDRVAADRARERLSRQGSFRFVGLRLAPDEGSPRDVVYELTEGRRYEVHLIGGYGSYDQLFGGAEFEHFNLWGIGHRSRLRAVQSFKSTQGTFVYSIPEVLVPDLNLYASADGFQREELTFERQEVKLALGVRKQFARTANQAGLRYSYEFLDAQTAAVGDQASRAGAVIADWQLDRRDNPLLPRRGTRLFANLEYAQPVLGGEADYVRLELAASHHHNFGRGLILHLGLQEGLVSSPDRTTLLPFNKRFFPGGENSVRGYQRGGASPLDANGDQIGAEAATQWNIEVEQQVIRAVSVVAFVDGVGITPEIENFPFDQVLWSAGLGVRWNTIIGPVRLEYGYNLTPREHDPTGTLHFSIGYPF